MNTEITDNQQYKGRVLYDANCRLCTGCARRFARLLATRHFQLLPPQTPGVRTELGLSEAQLLAEMKLLLPDGSSLGGADAVVEISRGFWWAWPLRAMARLAVGRSAMRVGYRWIAGRRYCANDACAVRTGVAPADLLPLLCLPFMALSFADRLPPWVLMWTMAFALFAGCKWLTFRVAVKQGALAPPRRTLAYLLGWPGMDARAFLDANGLSRKPGKSEWLMASGQTILGAALVWIIARHVAPSHPLLTGWVGMVGVIFALHFGTFHLHLGLLCAGLLMPRAVKLRAHLATLPEFIRRLFWVYYTFIGLCLVSFGLITVAWAPTLAAGSGLARAVCAFLAMFWTVRLVAATFVFDVRPYLTSALWRAGYQATNIAFIYLPVVYAWAAWKGGLR